MATIESSFSIFGSLPSTFPKSPFNPKSTPPISLHICTSTPKLSQQSLLHPSPVFSTKKQSIEVKSTAEDVAVLEEEQVKLKKVRPIVQKRKLFVLNLPWSYTVADIKNFFAQCGSVSDVEIIKQKDGKNRGFAFVTMATGEGAQAAISKLDSAKLSGRSIRVEFAKKFNKPRPGRSPAVAPLPKETRHKLYVSNLAWKTRSTHLREFFAGFNPISARVVFESPAGSSAGYGFVSFSTKEEAETAMSSLDGKELMGRPINLKCSNQNVEEEPESGSEEVTVEQSAES